MPRYYGPTKPITRESILAASQRIMAVGAVTRGCDFSLSGFRFQGDSWISN
jgi:hypothetical protein